MSVSTPPAVTEAFAVSGTYNIIPVPDQTGTNPGAASFTTGFPVATGQPIGSGGVPPSRGDMNGILFMLSSHVAYLQSGAGYVYNSSIATAIGGYNLGAVLMSSDGTGYWLNTVNNNTSDPDAGGSGWVPVTQYGLTTVSGLTGGSVTLTAAQFKKQVLVLSGTLTSNLTIVLPLYAGYSWVIVNSTTGAYTVTIKGATGTGATVVNGGWATASTVTSDGTNFYSQSGSFVTSSQLTATLASYVTSASLLATLSGYVTNSSLASTLGSYVTSASLASTLSNYSTTSQIAAAYVSNSALTSTLANYLTTANAASTYVTNSLLTTTLSAYVTASSLTSTLASYVTASSLTSTLASYVTAVYLASQLANYATKASPAFTGTPTAPTAPVGTANTQIATTEFSSGTLTKSSTSIDQVFSSGLAMKCGVLTPVTSPTSVTFPTAFSTVCLGVIPAPQAGNETLYITAVSRTGFSFNLGVPGDPVFWIAVGY